VHDACPRIVEKDYKGIWFNNYTLKYAQIPYLQIICYTIIVSSHNLTLNVIIVLQELNWVGLNICEYESNV